MFGRSPENTRYQLKSVYLLLLLLAGSVSACGPSPEALMMRRRAINGDVAADPNLVHGDSTGHDSAAVLPQNNWPTLAELTDQEQYLLVALLEPGIDAAETELWTGDDVNSLKSKLFDHLFALCNLVGLTSDSFQFNSELTGDNSLLLMAIAGLSTNGTTANEPIIAAMIADLSILAEIDLMSYPSFDSINDPNRQPSAAVNKLIQASLLAKWYLVHDQEVAQSSAANDGARIDSVALTATAYQLQDNPMADLLIDIQSRIAKIVEDHPDVKPNTNDQFFKYLQADIHRYTNFSEFNSLLAEADKVKTIEGANELLLKFNTFLMGPMTAAGIDMRVAEAITHSLTEQIIILTRIDDQGNLVVGSGHSFRFVLEYTLLKVLEPQYRPSNFTADLNALETVTTPGMQSLRFSPEEPVISGLVTNSLLDRRVNIAIDSSGNPQPVQLLNGEHWLAGDQAYPSYSELMIADFEGNPYLIIGQNNDTVYLLPIDNRTETVDMISYIEFLFVSQPKLVQALAMEFPILISNNTFLEIGELSLSAPVPGSAAGLATSNLLPGVIENLNIAASIVINLILLDYYLGEIVGTQTDFQSGLGEPLPGLKAIPEDYSSKYLEWKQGFIYNSQELFKELILRSLKK